MAKYEAHITYHRADRAAGEAIGEPLGWKGSAIDPDPIMGDKPYAYLTAYDPDPLVLLTRMRQCVLKLWERDVLCLRQKIERIVYDTKTDVNEISQAV